MFEMMMYRRHLEHALAGGLVADHLDDDRYRLQHEQPADDRQHDFMTGDDRDRSKRAATREAAGIAHEHRGGRRLLPEARPPRPDDRRAEPRKLARSGHTNRRE